MFGADATDRITAWRPTNGDAAWTSRQAAATATLSAPLVVGKSVVFGDAKGKVHWLARDTGEPLLRLPTDGSADRAPAGAGRQHDLVVTRNGGLFAFRPE